MAGATFAAPLAAGIPVAEYRAALQLTTPHSAGGSLLDLSLADMIPARQRCCPIREAREASASAWMIVSVDGWASIVQDDFHNFDGACFKAARSLSAYRPAAPLTYSSWHNPAMTPVTLFILALLSPLAGTAIGIASRGRLPTHHLSRDAIDVIKLAARAGELAEPCRFGAGGGSEDYARAFEFFRGGGVGVDDVRERDAGLFVRGVDGEHRAVDADGADRGVEPAENALGFAEGVDEDDAGAAVALVAAPPGVDAGELFVLVGPAEDGEAEGALADESVAADGLERCGGGIGVELVVAAEDDDVSAVFDADL